jgi:hypothetical protein
MFDHLVVDKFAITSPKTRPQVAHMCCNFASHIGLGFSSLAYRHFPESQTSLGVPLIQNGREMVTMLTQDLLDHDELIDQPNLHPLVAQRAIDAVLASWLQLQKDQNTSIVISRGWQTIEAEAKRDSISLNTLCCCGDDIPTGRLCCCTLSSFHILCTC